MVRHIRIKIIHKSYGPWGSTMMKASARSDHARTIGTEPLLQTCFYLRGAFLACGSVNKPEGEYHLEITCATDDLAGIPRN